MTKTMCRNLHAGATLPLLALLGLASTTPTMAQQRAGLGLRSDSTINRVLLYVDGAPISQARFDAKRALVAEQQKAMLNQVETSQEDLDAMALGLAIEEQVLLNEAKAQGIGFSDTEIIQRVRSMQDSVEASGDEDAKAAFHWGIAQNGLREGEFASDPSVISAYREAFTLGEIRWRIIAVPALDGENATATPQSRIEGFVQRRRAKIQAVDPSIAKATELVRHRLHLE
jgi:hypothetical protein